MLPGTRVAPLNRCVHPWMGRRVAYARRALCVLALLASGCARRSVSEAEVKARATQDAVAVLASEQARTRALLRRDIPALDTLLAPDLVYTHTNALRESKQEMLESMRSGRIRYDSLAMMKQEVRWLWSGAVVTGEARVQALLAPAAAPVRLTLRYTSVYRARSSKGAWELVAWQSTRVPEPPSGSDR